MSKTNELTIDEHVMQNDILVIQYVKYSKLAK